MASRDLPAVRDLVATFGIEMATFRLELEEGLMRTLSETQKKQLDRVVRMWSEHRCAEPGPYGHVCTDHRGHRYAHYDASEDTSWTDRWEEDFDVEDPDQHPIEEDVILAAIYAARAAAGPGV